MDWLEHLGAEHIRVNAEDLQYPNRFSLSPTSRLPCLVSRPDPITGIEKVVSLAEVRSVWYWRWWGFDAYHQAHLERFSEDYHRQYEIMRFLEGEIEAAGMALFCSVAPAYWLSDPHSSRLDKMRVLAAAKAAGLDVPETVIATSREAVRELQKRHPKVITKCLGRLGLSLELSGGALCAYTSGIDASQGEDAPEVFFPSLVQEHIEKRYELRVFFLDDRFHAMAIFSQSDPQTAMDFRRYNDERPNRCVPYRLPAEVQDKLRSLMGSLGLRTGSLDLIRATDGRHVFLEVNPVGQFGMVSTPCNYHLEKLVAQHLASHDRD